MGSPIVFSGRRSKLLSADGILTSTDSKIDFDGNINYILNGHAEVNTDGWATYADAAATTPADGTGGSPTVTWTRSTSTPLRGQGSFLLTKDAADRQGEGASYDFTIDTADQGTPLQIQFDWTLVSGTFTGSSTAGTNSDVTVWIYDTTNNSLISPAGILLEQPVTTNYYTFKAVFQPAINSTTYRLIFHVTTTSASAYVLKFDDIKVSPQDSAVAIVPKEYTVQKFTTATTATYTTPADVYMIRVRMVGGGAGGASSGLNGTANNGNNGGASYWKTAGGAATIATANGGTGGQIGVSSAGGTASISSPAFGTTVIGGYGTAQGGYEQAANYYSEGGSGGNSFFGGGGGGTVNGTGGYASANTGGGGGGGGFHGTYGLGSGGGGGGAGGYCEFYIANPSSSYQYTVGAGGAINSAGTNGFPGGAGADGYIEVLEYYRGQNVQMSNDTSTRVVAAKYTTCPSTAMVSGSTYALDFTTKEFDTHGQWTSTGSHNSTLASGSKYTCSVSGYYRVTAHVILNNLGTDFDGVNEYWVIALRKNGTQISYLDSGRPASGAYYPSRSGSTIVQCNAGDYLQLTSLQNSGADQTTTTTAADNFISIERVSGPNQIAASETVSARVNSSTTTMPASGTFTTAVFTSTDWDSHNAVSSGVFTAPISGVYIVSASLRLASLASGSFGVGVWVNGTQKGTNGDGFSSATTETVQVTEQVRLLAGNTVEIKASQSTGGDIALNGSAVSNYFAVTRIGNY